MPIAKPDTSISTCSVSSNPLSVSRPLLGFNASDLMVRGVYIYMSSNVFNISIYNFLNIIENKIKNF
jgi:hypothetical protein